MELHRQPEGPIVTDAASDPARAPTVSVLMAVHNGEPHVRQAVDSILGQSLADFEFIIIDDHSTDGTPDYLARLDDPRIRLHRNAGNLGLTKSLNVGLDMARGRYIARMDADDIALPERLARQVAFLDANADHVLLGTGVVEIDGAGAAMKTDRQPMDDMAFRWTSLLRPPLRHPTAMFRSDPVKDAGLRYDETCRTAQDFDFWQRALAHGKAAVLGQPLLRYRVHDSNVTATRKQSQLETHRRIAVRNIERLFPPLTTDRAAINDLFSLYLGEAEAGSANVAAAARAMERLVAAFCARENLSPGQAADIRARAAMQLAIAVFVKAGARRRPAVLLGSLVSCRRLLWPLAWRLWSRSIGFRRTGPAARYQAS